MSNFLSDIAALAKAGYKFDEVKELMTMSKENAVTISDNSATKPASANEAPAGEVVAPVVSDGKSYKELYEETKSDLQKLQEANTHKEVDEPDLSIDSIVTDLSKFLH